jgi:SAM-dependent methyltransferase
MRKRAIGMNEDKFTGISNIYAKYRPTYPDLFISYLYKDLGFDKNSTIADIGSGTGILTKLLLKQDSMVYAIEPNADMRKNAEESLSNFCKFKSINASAEYTGLAESSVDFITVAQAFHWFDRNKFKIECQRILRDKGLVVLVWNSRDSESELVQENDVINKTFCPDFKGFSGGDRGESPEEYNDFFQDGICEYKIFNHELSFDEEGFIGRNLSASYAPKTGEVNYEPYILALRQLFNKYNKSGYLYMPNLTRSYVGKV